jgi:uncharacterized protein (TIGR02145 family)
MNKSIFNTVVAVVFLMGFGVYAQTKSASSISTFKDNRDGKVYRIVQIGRQVWFAENLNYAAKGSVCYDNKTDYCSKYGRLYYWDAAKKACPAGWHVATDDDWTTLINYVGGDSTAGTKLKSSTGWRDKGNGTNDYGFSAIPGGRVDSDGRFDNVGYFNADDIGYWWNDMEDNDNPAGVIIMNYIDIDNLNKEVIRSEGGQRRDESVFGAMC